MPHEATGTERRPALTADQWSRREYESFGDSGVSLNLGTSGVKVVSSSGIDNPADLAAVIALANSALPARDPHKFTREHVRLLRGAAERIAGSERAFAPDGLDRPTEEIVAEGVIYSQLIDLAGIIASYLPPPARG